PQIGALSSMLDVQPRTTLANLIQQIQRVDDVLVDKALLPIADGFRILAGPSEVGSLPSVDPAHLAKIVGYLKRLADVTVLDVPGTFNDAELEIVHAADHVILIGLQNIPSIRALKVFCETFPDERVDNSLWVVINRYNPDLPAFACS